MNNTLECNIKLVDVNIGLISRVRNGCNNKAILSMFHTKLIKIISQKFVSSQVTALQFTGFIDLAC